jgi:ParB/RepB/Spo0J family partition protein
LSEFWVAHQDELDSLKGSISKVGVLVPLTVYKNTRNVPKGQYIILDGERRWRCAKQLGMETIPANIIDEPEDITQNIYLCSIFITLSKNGHFSLRH